MNMQSDFSLEGFNTFGFSSIAEQYCEPRSNEELESVLRWAKMHGLSIHVLGGGSNVLMAPRVSGLVVRPAMKHKNYDIVDDHVLVRAGAGEQWHELVSWSVQQGWSGIESMALIPGSVGAAPVQNIGAYGTELKDVFHSLRAYDLKAECWVDFLVGACDFAYRDSRFKREPGRYVITEVVIKLRLEPEGNARYDALKAYFDKRGIEVPSVKQVFDGVCALRRSKLPDPALLGNAGSYFKNPIISAELHKQILIQWPKLVAYQEPDGQFKVAAGWLIDQCQWKGRRQGQVGVYEKQALVLVNYGDGTRDQLLELATQVQQSVWLAFGIQLEVEPQLFPR